MICYSVSLKTSSPWGELSRIGYPGHLKSNQIEDLKNGTQKEKIFQVSAH